MANENDSAIVEKLISLPVSEQLPYLLEIKDKILDDSCYWQVVAGVWIGSEVCSPYLKAWRDLFTEPRRNRQKLMKGSDRKVWHSLTKRGAPKLVTAYRAMNPDDDAITAISWTLSKKVAQQLARGRKIVSLEIPKECIIAYFDRRKEQEIIHLYEEVHIKGL
jgi:hypothetical protein